MPRATWSRRRFIADSLLSVLLLPMLSPDLNSTARPLPSAPRSSRPDRRQRGQSRAPPREAATRLTTPVYINGHGPYQFLVDTGAERSILAARIAARLALPRCPAEVLLQGIILAQKTAEVKIARLAAGSVTCTDLRVPILPGAMLGADGYLGLDVLNGHRVEFDFESNTLRIEHSQGFFSALWTGDDQIRIRAKGDSGRLRSTDCYADDLPTTAFIDSGAQVSVCNPSLYAALRHGKAPPLPIATLEVSGITGGTIVGTVIVIDTVRLPGLTFTAVPVVVADLPVFKFWGLSRTPAILIGMNCLRAFSSVTIDYGRKELLFRVAAPQQLPWTWR